MIRLALLVALVVLAWRFLLPLVRARLSGAGGA